MKEKKKGEKERGKAVLPLSLPCLKHGTPKKTSFLFTRLWQVENYDRCLWRVANLYNYIHPPPLFAVVWVVGEVCPAHCDPTRLFVAGQDCTEHGLCCGYPNNLYCCTDYWDRPRAPLPDIRTEADCRPSENAAPSTLPTSNLLATGRCVDRGVLYNSNTFRCMCAKRATNKIRL